LAGLPASSADGPSTTCSLTITASKPADSAVAAMSTRSASAGTGTIVQFSLRMSTILGALTG
jgi:hypothetical protein